MDTAKLALPRLPASRARLLLLGLAALLLVPPALFNPFAEDEACYAAIARAVARGGDWLTFQYNGNPFWEKPPLVLWGMSASFVAFGPGELAARLVPMACGMLLLLLIFQFARLQGGVRLGMLAALILLCCQDFVRFSARGQMDVPLTLLLSAGLICFWIALERPNYHLLAGLCFGLAVATKNQTGLWGWLIQWAYILVARDLRPTRQWQWYAAAPLGLAVAAPWFLEQYWRHGSSFVDSYYHYNFGLFRETAALQAADGGVDYAFYLRYLILNHSLVIVPAALAAIWALDANLKRGERLGLLCAVWLTMVLVVCSFCGRKLYWYLMPMYPACALLLALGMARWSVWRRHPDAVLAGVALAAVGIQLSYYLPPPRWPVFRATRSLAAAVVQAVPADATLFLLTDRGPGRPEPRLEPCEQATHFYCDRVARFLRSPTDLARELARRGPLFALASPDLVSSLYDSTSDAPEAASPQFELLAARGVLGLYRVVPATCARHSASAPDPIR